MITEEKLAELRTYENPPTDCDETTWEDILDTLSALWRVAKAAEKGRCPNCPDQGWYVVPDKNTGEAEQEQCQWCYETTESLFNALAALRKGKG